MTVMSAATASAKTAGTANVLPTDLATVDNNDFLREFKRRLIEGTLDPDTFDAALNTLLDLDDDQEDVDSPSDLVTAADWWRRGDKREALHFLEYALGRDFSGIGDLKPEDLL